MKQNCTLPETVEYKSCTATIYLQKNRKALRYEARFYDVDGSMQRLTFPTYSSAKKFAEREVKEIAVNREHNPVWLVQGFGSKFFTGAFVKAHSTLQGATVYAVFIFRNFRISAPISPACVSRAK